MINADYKWGQDDNQGHSRITETRGCPQSRSAAVIVLAVTRSRSTDAAPPAPASPFAGKSAFVLLGGEGRHAYLTDSRVEELGGKPVLVGHAIDPVSDKPLKGAVTWMAVEQVLRIDVFDNQEALVERMKQQPPR